MPVLEQNVVLIRAGKKRGTGFFFGQDGSLLTCFHVVGNQKTGKLTTQPLTVTFKQIKYEAECVFVPPDPQKLDVAVLRIAGGNLPLGAALLPLGKWEYRPKQTNRFRTLGFKSPEIFKGLYAEGEIRGLVPTKSNGDLQLASQAIGAQEIRKGMSGAPVYNDATEQVVGMISWYFEEPQKDLMTFAVPIEKIADSWLPLKDRLRQEELLEQLSRILVSGEWFTEKMFKLFYEGLPFPNRVEYDELDEDKPRALIEQIRNSGQSYDFVNWLRVRRPDIPLAKLLKEVPPVHRIHFVNRDDELRDACDRYAPPYILFEAPAGYGKTELLKAIEQRHFRDGWLCIYTETPEDVTSAIDLANQVARQTGFSKDLSHLYDIDAMGYTFAGLLLNQLDPSDVPGIVLLVDSVERLPKEEIDAFLNQFLVAILNVLRSFKVRVRLAGRYVGSSWKKLAKEYELAVRPLTPFRYRYVKDTVDRLSPTQQEPALCAAYLMHMTGGHPGCMAEIMQCMNPNQTVEEDRKANQDSYKDIVLAVAHEIRESIPEPLRNAFDVLSVFRLCNYRLLDRIIEAELIEYEGNADSLEKALTATYLARRKNGFIQDEIVRRLLALRLRWEESERFFALCEMAQQTYEQDLQSAISRPEFIAMEGLYQELQLSYYQSEQNLAARNALRNRYFADADDDGILNRYLEALVARPDPKDVMEDFKTLLKDERRNWEFQFALNFFLRGDQYDNEPYEEMLKQVAAFSAPKVGKSHG